MKNPVSPSRRDFLQTILAGGAAMSLAGCKAETTSLPNLPKGPALVYTAWNGIACGTMHDLPKLQEASQKLGIPLYVINSLPELGPLTDDKPHDDVIPVADSRESGAVLGAYDLTFQDVRVRLIDVDGKVVPTKDVSSKDDLVAAFSPLLAQARISSAATGRSK